MLAAHRNPSRPFRVTRLVLGVVLGLSLSLIAAGPAAADIDNYLEASELNSFGSVLPGSTTRNSDNTGATERFDDLFEPVGSGGPEENLGCTRGGNTVFYGATEWYDLHPQRTGVVRIFADGTGFTPMAAIMPFNRSNSQPDYSRLTCLSASGLGALDFSYLVSEGSSYSIQLGGVNDDPSDVFSPSGMGAYQLTVGYDPDTDRDGVVDSADRCDTVRGPASNGGCPPPPAARPDRDFDGIFDDGPDKCLGENARGRDNNPADGCLDPVRLDRLVKEIISGRFPGGRYLITKFTLSGVTPGARISAKCVGPKRRGRRRRSCGSQLIRKASVSSRPKAQAAKTRKLSKFIGKRLRVGSVITIRVTARRSIGRYIKIRIVRKGGTLGTKRSYGCMNQGAVTKFKRRGCR